MTPAAIIREAQIDGVKLSLSATGAIKAIGDQQALTHWLPIIREHKPEILAALQEAANDTPLTPDEETAIRAWLAHINETDQEIIADVLHQCQHDADARDYFSGRAAAELPKPDPLPDDRCTCGQCANLIAQRCQAAKRGEIVASRNYEPIRDPPRWCEGYAPGPDDPDRRHGRERWPGLNANTAETTVQSSQMISAKSEGRNGRNG